jgi:hypothetical protein
LLQRGASCWRRQESIHLFKGQSFGESCSAFGACDSTERILWDQALVVQIPKETFQGRNSSRIAAMGDVSAAALLQKTVDNSTVYLAKGFFLFLLEKTKE